MLNEVDNLIKKREDETGVTTAESITGNTKDKVLLKLRASYDKISEKIRRLDVEYPDIRNGKGEEAEATIVAEMMLQEMQSAPKTTALAATVADPEEKAL